MKTNFLGEHYTPEKLEESMARVLYRLGNFHRFCCEWCKYDRVARLERERADIWTEYEEKMMRLLKHELTIFKQV